MLGRALAIAGALVLLVAVLFLDWYSVGEGKIAPITIMGPRADAVPLAQVTDPGVPLPGPPEIPDDALEDAASPPSEPELGAWDSPGALGTVANLLLLLAAVGALVSSATGATFAGRSAGVLTAGLGILATLAVVLRMVLPVEDVDGYEFNAGLEPGIFVALAGAALIAVGGVLARGDENPARRPV